MKTKAFLLVSVAIMVFVASCKKVTEYSNFIGDDKKIDIKGSLMSGDMRHSNIEAGYLGKTLYVYFHDYLGECTVSVSNAHDSLLFSETIPTYPSAEVRYYMGDLPMSRYHLVISDGYDEAEGWFNNFRIVAVKPH